ncbi:MAG: YggS family pyridoxal phosphate-dependent enzyme [Bacteroidota bacterium]|nr:YggS family pyridoxal phosphate-dependent enzyme [Bacteroidota bacterium]
MNLQENLTRLEDRIAQACARAGRRRTEVLLVAVSKTQPTEVIRAAYDLGIRDFGENRVQELLKKKDYLPDDIRWHMIGHLQSNKAKYVAPFIRYVHSIDSIETAIELSKRARQSSRLIDVLLEINVAGEASKEGIAVSECKPLLELIFEQAPSIRVRGLMTVAPFEPDAQLVRPYFRELRKLRDELALAELSMGMTNDFEVAIEEGATMIRLGSALFGSRPAAGQTVSNL